MIIFPFLNILCDLDKALQTNSLLCLCNHIRRDFKSVSLWKGTSLLSGDALICNKLSFMLPCTAKDFPVPQMNYLYHSPFENYHINSNIVKLIRNYNLNKFVFFKIEYYLYVIA